MSRIRILNTYIDNLTYSEAVEAIHAMAVDKKTFQYVVTPNVDDVVHIETDAELAQIFNSADLNLADGKPLVVFSRKTTTPIKEKISGRVLLPLVCEMASKNNLSMFFLGAAEGVADLAKKNLCEKYPRLQIVGTYSPPLGFESNEKELERIRKMITSAEPDIMILAMGGFKQQRLIWRYKDEYGVPVSLCLGAAIDFAAGVVDEIPDWASNAGLGWLFRIKNEPKRMVKRYFFDAIAFSKIIKKYS